MEAVSALQVPGSGDETALSRDASAASGQLITPNPYRTARMHALIPSPRTLA